MLKATLDEHIYNALKNDPTVFRIFDLSTKEEILKNYCNITLSNLALWFDYEPDLIIQYLHGLLYNTGYNPDIYNHKNFIFFCIHNMDLLIENELEALCFLDIFKKGMKKQNVNYFIQHLINIYEGDEETSKIIIAKIQNEFLYDKKLLKHLKFILAIK